MTFGDKLKSRHGQIQDHEVRLELEHLSNSLVAIRGLAHHLSAGVCLEKFSQTTSAFDAECAPRFTALSRMPRCFFVSRYVRVQVPAPNVIQVLSDDRSHVDAMFMTIPTPRI